MTGPPWLAGALAALMILVAAAAAARLCWWRLHGRPADADADALHVLMGIAMAGMFEPGIGPVPAIAWQFVFAVAATWFTWQAARRRARQRYPDPAVAPRASRRRVRRDALHALARGGTPRGGRHARHDRARRRDRR